MTASIYRPLNSDKDEIRLLKIEPAPSLECEVVCSLSTISLHTKPVFAALSYCWGDEAVTKPIVLEGVARPVTVNLEAALRYFRDSDQATILWADAVCINQSDRSERSSQVLLMRAIYSTAAAVKIWLGEAANGSDDVMQIVGRILHEYRQTSDKVAFMHSFDLDGGLRKAKTGVSDVRALSERAWWSRIWIVQEALLSQNAVMYCGRQYFSFTEFLDFGQTMIHVLSSSGAPFAGAQLVVGLVTLTMMRFIYIRRLQNSERTIHPGDMALQVLSGGMYQQAKDPRDKIYGMLGLLPDSKYQIQPHYDWTVERLYTEYALHLMRASASLSALILVPNRGSRNLGLPSWVPDWRTHDHRSSQASQRAYDTHFNACGAAWLGINFDAPSTLRLRGILFGCILSIGEELGCIGPHCSAETTQDLEVQYQTYKSWLHLSGLTSLEDDETCIPYAGGGTMRTAFWQTISHGLTLEASTGDYMGCRAEDTDFPLFRDWWKWLSTGGKEEDLLGNSQVKKIHSMIYAQNDHRRFFALQSGHIGVGPRDIIDLDTLYILSGGRHAYVLRLEVPITEPPTFTFVGTAYVHGYMNGEIFKPTRAGQHQGDSTTSAPQKPANYSVATTDPTKDDDRWKVIHVI